MCYLRAEARTIQSKSWVATGQWLHKIDQSAARHHYIVAARRLLLHYGGTRTDFDIAVIIPFSKNGDDILPRVTRDNSDLQPGELVEKHPRDLLEQKHDDEEARLSRKRPRDITFRALLSSSEDRWMRRRGRR